MFAVVVAVVDNDPAAAAVALGPELVRTMGSVMEDDTATGNVISMCLFSTFI